MFSGRGTISDPDLGECTVIGGSRFAVALFSVLGCALLGAVGWSVAQAASGTADQSGWGSSQLALMLVLGAVSITCAVWYWRTDLTVGERGFRLVRPFQRVQLMWGQVSSCDLKYEHTRREQLVVGLRGRRDGEADAIQFSSATFSASGHAIWQLMSTRWKAFNF